MTKEQFLEHCGWSEDEFDHVRLLLGQGFYRYALSVTDPFDHFLYVSDLKEHKDMVERTSVHWNSIKAIFETFNEEAYGLPEWDAETKLKYEAFDSVTNTVKFITTGNTYVPVMKFLMDINAKGVSWIDIKENVNRYVFDWFEANHPPQIAARLKRDEQRSQMTQMTQTTRAREDDPTLLALEQILVIQLEQDLDLNDPEDFDVYSKSKDLLEHVRETLDHVRQEISNSEPIQGEEEA